MLETKKKCSLYIKITKKKMLFYKDQILKETIEYLKLKKRGNASFKTSRVPKINSKIICTLK